ncbi:Hypothetical predicted protein [Paramuricea clavata]|uniref:Uncharacterized protein n=1 Tax=Paramuricea clavata TaxID=317549 RepID=A0A6S7G2P6_PARCT|nr:Hypothetical predicted protein [Paramuricea clavata]
MGTTPSERDMLNSLFAGDGEAVSHLHIERLVAETVAKTLPLALSSVLAAGDFKSLGVTPTQSIESAATDQVQTQPGSSGGDCFYITESEVEFSDDLRERTTQAFSKSLYQRKHGKDVFAFDDALAEKQGAFFLTARPILAAHTALDHPSEEEGPNPDLVKGMLLNALVLLGNANVCLNSWPQHRFSKYLMDVGKCTVKEDLPRSVS